MSCCSFNILIISPHRSPPMSFNIEVSIQRIDGGSQLLMDLLPSLKEAAESPKAVKSFLKTGEKLRRLIYSFGVGNGNPLQYPCQENSMARGAWQATVRGVAKSQT